MTIEMSKGCTAFWTTIDGVNVSHQPLTYEQWKQFVSSLMNIDPSRRVYFIESVIESFGEIVYEDEEPCESCGDYVIQYKLEL